MSEKAKAPHFDTVITNGTLVLEKQTIEGNIGIKNGEIAALLEKNEPFSATNEINVQGKVVLPGVIDPHVHLWEPSPQSYREDYLHGTKAAAQGGVTTVIEMPLSVPPVTDATSFHTKLNAATKNAVVDFSLWGGLIESSMDNLSDLNDLGCIGYKAFISYCNENYPHTPDHILYEGMKKASEFNGLVGVHAENADIVNHTSKVLESQGKMDPVTHAESRPAFAEIDAIQRAILFAENADCRLHIVHMSVAEGGEIIKDAKERGVKVTNETCPHYLLFDGSILEEKGPYAKCNPPYRSRENIEKIWEQLFKGNIDMIGSDHSPHTDEDKVVGETNIWEAPAGIGGIDVLLAVMLSEGVNKRGLSLQRLAELTSTNVAKTFNLYPKKGTLSVDSDADITIIDLNEEWTYEGMKSFSKTKTSKGVYEGLDLKGKVVSTIVRGSLVYHDDQILVEPGYGDYVPANKG